MDMPDENAPWRVGYYRDHRGKSPILEFINILSASDTARVIATVELLLEFGVNLGMPHARPLRDCIWELRAGPIRLLYFADVERRFVILHAFRKTTQKTPDHEIETALRRMRELKEK